jgi:hypothetical protein
MGLFVTNVSRTGWRCLFWEFGALLLRVQWSQHQDEQLPQLTATQLYVVCLEMSVIQTTYSIERKKKVLLLHPVSFLLTFQ